MITKNILLLITLCYNIQLFSMLNNTLIDYKKYNFTQQDQKDLKTFRIEKDAESDQFKVCDSGNLFKMVDVLIKVPGSDNFSKVVDFVNNDTKCCKALQFNFTILEPLPDHSPKIQHFVKKMYYHELCNSRVLQEEGIDRHAHLTSFTQNIAVYTPDANNYKIESHKSQSYKSSVGEYATVSVGIIMFFGFVTSLLLNNENIACRTLDATTISILLFLVYGSLNEK